MVDRLNEYCVLWGLEISMAKSEVVIMQKRGGRKCRDENWMFGTECVKIVKKYLRVEIFASMSMEKHLKGRVNKLNEM